MNRFQKLLWANAALVVVSVNWFTWQKEELAAEGRRVLLEIGKYDPLSLMQGHYMQLNYEVAVRIDAALGETDRRDGVAVLSIDADDVGTFRRLFAGETLAPDEQRLRYKVRGGWLNPVRVAATEFFFQEGLAAEFERARFAELRMDRDGNTLLVALRDAQRQPIGEPR